MLSQEIKQYLQQSNFKITPLEFFTIVDSSQDIIDKVLLESNNAVYTILTKDGKRMNAEIISEPKKLELKRDSN